MSNDIETIGPAIARILAPYIAAELGIPVPGRDQALTEEYDDHTAEVFVSGLGDPVLPRAEKFFGWLSVVTNGEDEGEPRTITSVRLARLLGLESPRQIASVLTNSLKKRAKRLDLPVPWIQDETHEGRTTWRCRDTEQAERLLRATQAELTRRGLPVALGE